jgi:hypothetical protein
MKKVLSCLFVLLLMLIISACSPKQVAEPEQQTEPPTIEPQEEVEPAEPISEAVLTEINIFHLGILTPLEINEEHNIALAQQLLALLDTAADADNFKEPPESALNPEQVKKGYTALELVYDRNVELPFIIESEPLTAHRLLYSIPNNSDEGGLLYVGHTIYEETPLGLFFDQNLQNAIFNSASDQVEQVTFSADGQTMILTGEEYPYNSGDNSLELTGRLLNRVLYRAVAFYKNAYTGNVNGLRSMSTDTLYEAVLQAHAGVITEYGLGEEIIANLNYYILADFFLPQTIIGPEKQGDNYEVFFYLNELVTVKIVFVVKEDTPLVSAMQIIKAE